MFDIGALLIFWSGVLEICKQSGFLTFVTKGVTFIIHPLLFKNLDKKSKAMEYISLNLTANILGVGSAATPFGLKAMQELDEINDHDSKASADMITFVTINTSGICIIPSTLISLRETYGSTNSTIVIPYIIIISTLTTLFVIFLNKVIQKYGKH